MNRNKVLSAFAFSIRELCAEKPVSACMFSLLPQNGRRVSVFPFCNAEVQRSGCAPAFCCRFCGGKVGFLKGLCRFAACEECVYQPPGVFHGCFQVVVYDHMVEFCAVFHFFLGPGEAFFNGFGRVRPS